MPKNRTEEKLNFDSQTPSWRMWFPLLAHASTRPSTWRRLFGTHVISPSFTVYHKKMAKEPKLLNTACPCVHLKELVWNSRHLASLFRVYKKIVKEPKLHIRRNTHIYIYYMCIHNPSSQQNTCLASQQGGCLSYRRRTHTNHGAHTQGPTHTQV